MGTEFGLTRAIVLIVLLASAPASAETWELRSAAGNVPGSAEIEAGQIDDAIRILTTELASDVATIDLAVLGNLCVAYAIKLEYVIAMRYCNEAVGHSSANASALNNRGVLRAVMGDRRGAVQDFRRASCLRSCGRDGSCDEGSLRATVLRNLARVNQRGVTSVYETVMFWPGG